MHQYRVKKSHYFHRMLSIVVIIGLSMTTLTQAMQDSRPSLPLQQIATPDLPDGFDLVKQAIVTIGGREAFDQITSMSLKGNMSAQMLTLAIEIHTAQNGRYIYKQSTSKGGVRTIGSDGTVGWRINPNTTQYELLDKADQIENMRQANIHKILLQVEDRFSSIETISREDFGGKNAYKVKLTTDAGKVEFMFFDTRNQMLLGVEIVDEQNQSFFMQFEDWETFGDVKLFRKMLLSRGGLVLETQFTEITINETDPEVFMQPRQVQTLVAKRKNDSNQQTPPVTTQPDGTD